MSLETGKDRLKELLQENLKLKAELNAIKGVKSTSKSVNAWLSKHTSNIFAGKRLKASLFRLYNELPRNVTKDTMAEVSSHLIWRLTRIGVFAILIAVVPLLILSVQTYILSIQNDKIQSQNDLILNQNRRLDQQIHLEEGNRRSSFIFLMSNIMDKIDEELKNNPRGDRSLSDELIGRIVSLSQALRPYKYLEDDHLIPRPLSPERGQLLFALSNSLLDIETYDKIFSKANFSYSDLREANFSGAYLKEANLSYANLPNVNFTNGDLRLVKLNGASLNGAVFENTVLTAAKLRGADLRGSALFNVNMTSANLANANLSNTTLNGDFTGTNLEQVKLKNAEVDFALLEGATFQSKEFLDSLQYYNVRGLLSIQDNYVLDSNIVSVGRTEIDTFYFLKPKPDSRLLLMEECEKTVLDIVQSSPEVKKLEQNVEERGAQLVYYTAANPFGAEDLGIDKDSVYLFRITTEDADLLNTLMWVQFHPGTGELMQVQPATEEPPVSLSYNKRLRRRLTEGCY